MSNHKQTNFEKEIDLKPVKGKAKRQAKRANIKRVAEKYDITRGQARRGLRKMNKAGESYVSQDYLSSLKMIKNNSSTPFKMKHSPLNDNGDDVSSSGGLTEEQKAIIAAHRATESDPTLPKWEHDISDEQILKIDSLKTGKGKYGDMSFKERYPLQKDIIREVWYKSMDPNKGTKIPSWINK